MEYRFLLDLDDTLMPNQHYYERQKAELLVLIAEHVFNDETKVLDAAESIRDDIMEHGYRAPTILPFIKGSDHEGRESLIKILDTFKDIPRALLRSPFIQIPLNDRTWPTEHCKTASKII